LWLALLLAAGTMSAASGSDLTLDRVVASIGNVALTQSDVEEEYRLELFLDGKTPTATPDRATFESVRERLIDQMLLLQEAEAEGVDRTDLLQKAARQLDEVEKKYADEKAFQASLEELGMSREQVLARLAEHELTLRLVDQRLRPAAWADRTEIEAYYQNTFAPEYVRRNKGPAPALSEVENQIREILVQQKIDELLPKWLEELKSSQHVRIHSF
jgi:parvulin-like peptidyl-prolyl isomerase